MENYIKLISHFPSIIYGIIVVIISRKVNFKKQKKGYEINQETFNNLVKNTIKYFGYLTVVFGVLGFFYERANMIYPITFSILFINMNCKIRRLSKNRRRVDKIV